MVFFFLSCLYIHKTSGMNDVSTRNLSQNLLKFKKVPSSFTRFFTKNTSFSYTAVEEDCTSGLVTEVSVDSNKVGADVLLNSCPQSCMPNPVEGLLEVYEDMGEVLLVLKIFLTKDS